MAGSSKLTGEAAASGTEPEPDAPRNVRGPHGTGQDSSPGDTALFERLHDYMERLHRGESSADSLLASHDSELAGLLNGLELLAPERKQPQNGPGHGGQPFLPTILVPGPAESPAEDGHSANSPCDPRTDSQAQTGRQADSRPSGSAPADSSLDSSRRTDDCSSFGRFDLQAEIGRGGMGVVYRARQSDLNRTVALKMIRASHLASVDEIRRFYAEARAAARMQHPGVVGVHEVGQLHGQHYFVMDLVEGENLAARAARERMPLREAAQLMAHVADAVEYLHQHGVIHRDLKPSNILLDERGCPRVTDFGLARIFSGDSGNNETQTGTIIGTPAYMAPEQAAGRIREISPQSDIYSLGAILYELLTGRPPFQRSNPLDTLMEVIESEPPLPRSLNNSIPEELELICLRCLEKDPGSRYRSAAEMGADLERWLRGESITASSRGWITRVRRWARREPALVAHWSGLLAAAGIVEVSYRLIGGDSAYHSEVMWQLGLWAVVSFVFQRMLSSGLASGFARYSWAGADSLLLTSLLCSVRGDIGPLLIGYPLLVVASGMFFQVRLVGFMTVACLLSYAALCVFCPPSGQPAHYPFIFSSVLAIVGGLVAWQVFRIRTLCHYFEHRRPG